MTLFLDAAGTLIHPAEPVGEVYARHLAAVGVDVAPSTLDEAFRRSFADAPEPDYRLHPFGHATERAWWRELVLDTLASLGPAVAALTGPDDSPGRFDRLFAGLFDHYAAPEAWSLFPDVVPFLERAAPRARLAVLSNFDDRLGPVLDGLGIGPCFELVLTSADARARKPDRRIFDLALDRLNCAPAETVHAGDSHEADFEGARSAGLRAFHLVRPRHTLLDFLDFSLA